MRAEIVSLSRLLLCWLLTCVSAGAAYCGTLERHSFQSDQLKREFFYTVYLPDGYEIGRKSYPVLYLLHGAYGTDGTWIRRGNIHRTADRLISTGQIPPMIIVMPGCRGCWWVDTATSNSETAFWSELVPDVERRLRVIRRREGRVIAGNSMGGFGAIRYAFAHPDRFVAAAALSPAIYADAPPRFSAVRKQKAFLNSSGRFDIGLWRARNYPALLPGYLLQPYRVAFYLSSGDHDRLGIAFETALLFKNLFGAGQRSVELRINNGGHSWQLWSEHMRDALSYLGQFVVPPEVAIENSDVATVWHGELQDDRLPDGRRACLPDVLRGSRAIVAGAADQAAGSDVRREDGVRGAAWRRDGSGRCSSGIAVASEGFGPRGFNAKGCSVIAASKLRSRADPPAVVALDPRVGVRSADYR